MHPRAQGRTQIQNVRSTYFRQKVASAGWPVAVARIPSQAACLHDIHRNGIRELVERLRDALPAYGSPDAEYVELVLGSFLALVSAARIQGPSGSQPMIQVRYQFWLRELARLVSSVGPTPSGRSRRTSKPRN